MGYRVKGTLKLPDGTPGTNCEIEFTSRKNFTPMLTGMGVSIRTDSAGAYDVTLEYGAYAVILRTGNTYPTAIGQVVVAPDTVAGQDLPTLLEKSGWMPATPEYIQQITEWLAEANASATRATASASAAKVSASAAKVSETNSKASEIAAEADRSDVAVNAADVRVKHSDVVAKSAQVSIDSSATQAAKSTAVSAADTATQKALAAAESEASAFSSATRSEASAVKSAADGATQAALAKSQADRAKAEADRASQISGLGTVSDAIGLAAMPLPDVWAPLSDSLRMITGYGRDVLVGSDVVARMVNFSRSTTATYIGKDGRLKTAAANEPRFEKEGLLLEGASTNLVTRSVDMTQWPWVGSSAGTGVAPVVTGNYASAPDGSQTATRLILNKGAGTSEVNQATVACGLNTTVGAPYTLSVWLKSTDGVSQPVVSLSLNGDSTLMITVTSDWRRYQITTLSARDTNRAPRIQVRGEYGTSNIADILTWGWQQEALPFASSYIPTSGAAATRTAEICWIPVENNGLPGLDNEKTISLTSDIIGIRGPFNFIISTPWGGIDYTATHERVLGAIGTLNMNTPVALKTSVRKAARFTKGGGCSAIFGGIKKDGPTADWSIGTTRITLGSTNESTANPHFGHVRDLKIWLKPLTDEQMKAIA